MLDATDTDREPQIEMIPGTLVVFADDCGHAEPWVPGEVRAGEMVPGPYGDHDHLVERAVPVGLVTNVTVTVDPA